ncbi:hypothetical protein HK107_01005 [Parvularcula sp. ZS-1/3]|uniref:Uncharacterized protein n=1 Tax=Parvularcula mediterranea TaxID=2732508 RepID=A0A7Y3W3M1_9PROT|nr:hypothetical protein [Parvularcula mediterranea]NNU14900.1 hypothetical protein [Parvularcula mediterranea]
MKALTTVAAVLLMLLGAAIGAIFLTTPGFHNTSLDVRLLGDGKTPQQCIARFEKNFSAIEPHMTAVAKVIQREEQLPGVSGYVDRKGEFQLDLGWVQPEDSDEEPVRVRSLLSDSTLETLDREMEAITLSRNAYRPWEISHDPRDGAIVASLYAMCGQSIPEWWRYLAGRSRRATEPGTPIASVFLVRASLDPNDEAERCLEDGVKVGPQGFGVCVHDTGQGWVARQEWSDMCAWLNHRGWDGFFEDMTLNDESRAGFEYLRDQGQTPCQVLNR